jgi:simple sugar transport system ATP-binding protein
MISDRIAVIAEGRVSLTRPLASTNIEEIGTWMSGQFASRDVAVSHG